MKSEKRIDITILQQRAEIIKQIRAFFHSKNYLELDTPLLSDNLIPESCLEVFETRRIFPAGSKDKAKSMWLIPSPEIHMKKIIAEHKLNVFQICKCFRNGESEGHLHNPEFTMLEYYTMNVNYLDSLQITEELFSYLFREQGTGNREQRIESKELKKLIFERKTVNEAFKCYAGFDLFAASEAQSKMMEQARRLGLDPAPDTPIPVLYDLIFIHAVEPKLKMDKPIVLLDYPAFVPCLAKKSHDGKTVERWELYYNGIELANCFSEETDPQEVKNFFINEQTQKSKTALIKHDIDNDYWKIFENFPKCSGVAMGLDRLIMVLTGKSDIKSVIV